MTNKFLVVKLDQYAGNVDEVVCVALTGYGAGRYGEEQARKVFNTKVGPLLVEYADDSELDEEYPELPIEFMQFDTEYGLMPYALDSSSINNLRLGIDSYTTIEMVKKMLDIWQKAYGNGNDCLEITVNTLLEDSVTVKILGFDFVTVVESRESL